MSKPATDMRLARAAEGFTEVIGRCGGSPTDAIAASGYHGSAINTTEEFNGSTWGAGGNYPQYWGYIGGGGNLFRRE